MRKLKAAMDI